MRAARSGPRFTGSLLPPFVILHSLVEGPEVHLPEEFADLARFVLCGVEPAFDAGVDLGQKLHGLAQGPDQLFLWHVVHTVGNLLELPDLLLETPQIVLLSPAILHKSRTIHHPDPVFGPQRTLCRSDLERSLRPCSARRRAPQQKTGT